MGDDIVSDRGPRPGGADHQLGHVSEIELSALLDDDLGPAERRRVEAHLDACADCRRDLIEARRLVDSYKPSTFRMPTGVRARVAVGAALAAGLAAVLLLIPRSEMNVVPPSGAVRAPTVAGGREGELRIQVVSPASDVAVPSRKVVFIWRATAADVYRLTLLTESGKPLWSFETADTSGAAPRGKAIRPGAYFWRVDAIAAGIAATTGARPLRVSP